MCHIFSAIDLPSGWRRNLNYSRLLEMTEKRKDWFGHIWGTFHLNVRMSVGRLWRNSICIWYQHNKEFMLEDVFIWWWDVILVKYGYAYQYCKRTFFSGLHLVQGFLYSSDWWENYQGQNSKYIFWCIFMYKLFTTVFCWQVFDRMNAFDGQRFGSSL